MAEHDDREEASRRYGELPREEPPEALDAAIRAHARRAVELHPAPLVPPTGRREWYFPLAAAAILVLAVAVTWHVEREQPDMVAVGQAPQPASAPAETRAEPAKPQREPQAEPPATKDAAGARRKVEKAPSRDNAVLAKEQPARDEAVAPAEPQQEAKAAASPAPPAPMSAPSAASERRADAARPQLGAAARSEAMERRAFSETPEQWLERIAKLRAEGRHEEADRALAEFRKRHPDFRISPEMLEKVERR